MGISFDSLIKLAADNFTPLKRTPWAGSAIGAKYKKRAVPAAAGQLIGESWEFSCDPDFPSRLATGVLTLSELIAKYPRACVGAEDTENVASCEILVKLINAASPLSLQVHPADGDPYLKVNECGKPESWYVLDVEPGAGLYLGFSRPIEKNELRTLLQDGDRASEILNFVPVKPGDYFEISPTVPHALGPGVTILEPQRIKFGLSGKTYRMWDWGRRYNADGQVDNLQGLPRELHVEQSLHLVRPMEQVGAAFVETTRRLPQVVQFAGGNVTLKKFPANDYYQLTIVESQITGSITIEIQNGYGAVVALQGASTWSAVSGVEKVDIQGGESGFVPFAALKQHVQLHDKSAVALIIPATADAQFALAK